MNAKTVNKADLMETTITHSLPETKISKGLPYLGLYLDALDGRYGHNYQLFIGEKKDFANSDHGPWCLVSVNYPTASRGASESQLNAL